MANYIYNDKKVKKNLENYFKKYINRMNVSNKYKPLLVDILMRRADTYELSPEDIRQDVVSLLYNLNEISIGNMPEGYERASGIYIPDTKEILIAEGYSQTMPEDKLYQTLTHEVYHALSKDENGFDRLGGYNGLTGQYNGSLLEAIVEKSSYRAVFGNDRQSNVYFNNSADGYSDITFIIDALEATYGVSEKDLLKNAIMGRKRLAGFLAEHSGETQHSAYRFLDELEISYSQLHHTLYPFEEEEQAPYQKLQNISRALSGIYNLCENKMSERITNSKVQSYNDISNLNDNFKYSHNKLSAIMDDRINYFSTNYDSNIKDIVEWYTRTNRENTLVKINDIENVVQASQNFSNQTEFLNAYYWASTGRLAEVSPQCKAYYGIQNNFQYELPITQEIVNKEFEDEKFGAQYDNSKVVKLIKKVINKEKNIFKVGINKIKNLISRKDQKLLTSGANSINNYQAQNVENSTIFPTLTKDEQAYYNSQVKQAVENLDKTQTSENLSKDINIEER